MRRRPSPDAYITVEPGTNRKRPPVTVGGVPCHGTESRLTLFELEDFEQKVGVPAGFFTARLDATTIFVGAYEAESETANDGHILCAVAGSIS